MNTTTEVLITLSILIIIILLICWKMPSDKIKDARELLKVILPRIPIAGIVQAVKNAKKVK